MSLSNRFFIGALAAISLSIVAAPVHSAISEQQAALDCQIEHVGEPAATAACTAS